MKKKSMKSLLTIVGAVVLGFVIGAFAMYHVVMNKVGANVDDLVETTVSEVYDNVDYADEETVEEIMKETAKENIEEIFFKGKGAMDDVRGSAREIKGKGAMDDNVRGREIKGKGSMDGDVVRPIIFKGKGSMDELR